MRSFALRRFSRSLVSSSTTTPTAAPQSYARVNPLSNTATGTICDASFFTCRSFSSAAANIKELRTLSGAPIVDCKKALAETNSLDEALDWLRQHGTAKATKKLSGRQAEEGLVACAVSSDGKSASIVQVSSETDFAGKSDAFCKLAMHVADATLTSQIDGDLDVETVKTLQSSNKSVQEALEDAIVSIRENLGIAQAVKMTTSSDDAILVAYVHGKVDGSSQAGSAAAVVELAGGAGDNNTEKIFEAGKKLAMHIVAAKPLYLDIDSVPADVVEKEKAILQSQMEDSKKPPEVLEKIINGKLQKFFSEVCLTEQEHLVEEGNPKVGKALKSQGLTIKAFRTFFI
ncbi:translation elongation factor Ts [Nitzschia inconspicua]|uniref:Elongation factor Ts, mitochondrial n=1 Tax=Nitzschia inconspicua TaxID=303405 RepID=A0A9K3KCD6_9STRA|nr:translation elongation factor Ts [Nitzschia inconspicua]